MKTVIRPIGNSQGILIPKAVLDQLDMTRDDVVEIEVRGDTLVLRKLDPEPRAGWAEAASRLAVADGDQPPLLDFANADDVDLRW